MKYLPDLITLSRIAASIALIPINAFSRVFFLLYTYCGISDVLDGTLARATHSESENGARLDSAADIIFYAVMLIKVFPVLYSRLPASVWYAVVFILFIRILSYTVAAVKYRRFASLHTYMNKLTGFLIFTIPYIIFLPFAEALFFIICAVAAVSSAEELLIHIFSAEYNADIKMLFGKRRADRYDKHKTL